MMQAAYILISTRYGKERNVCRQLLEHDEVQDANVLYGQYDILVKLLAEDMKQIDKFILANIRSNPDIESTQSLIVVDTDD